MDQSHPARVGIATRRANALFGLITAGLVFAVACDGTSIADAGGNGGTSAGGAGRTSTAGASTAGASTTEGGAAGIGNDVPADAGAAGDRGVGDVGASGAAGDTAESLHCVASSRAPFVVGNYVDAAGNQLLLRTAAKAATFALVPAGAADPAKPPRLFRVNQVCAPGGALIASDESTSYRLDFTQTGDELAFCLSASVSTLDAATALSPADVSNASQGCAGKPFTRYTAEAL